MDEPGNGAGLPVGGRHTPRKVAAATRTLALLNKQADGLRAELERLRRAIADAHRTFNGTRAAQLRDANEQLVLCALQAESIAVTAVTDLGELTRTSQRDVLTDTPNRALMLDRLESGIAFARRHATRAAVLFIDVDHFKVINDSLGHSVGDEVIKLVARRLEGAVRGSDTVSRHGGDEFLVLLAEVADEPSAARVAMKILAALCAPSVIGDQIIRLSASLGIAVYPEDGDDAQTLIRRADAAMYRAKKSGTGRFALHSEKHPSGRSPTPTDGFTQRAPNSYDPDLAGHEPRLRHLREANEQLIIAALAAQELERQAQKAQRRQMELLAMVAHELRNPLAPLRTVADLMEHSRSDDVLAERVQVIIKSQVAYMSRLVDDLLDGSRAHGGVFRLECSSVDIADILRPAMEACRPAMATRSQHFAMRLPPQPLYVNGDSVRLIQVFSNLLDNASKYTGEGGAITLAVTTFEGSLTVAVSDNGIGITAAALPNIFDLFVQEQRALPLRNGGLGVGLAIVRDLVEAHGGTVAGWSAGRDCGSEFVVTLPLAVGPLAVAGPPERRS